MSMMIHKIETETVSLDSTKVFEDRQAIYKIDGGSVAKPSHSAPRPAFSALGTLRGIEAPCIPACRCNHAFLPVAPGRVMASCPPEALQPRGWCSAWIFFNRSRATWV